MQFITTLVCFLEYARVVPKQNRRQVTIFIGIVYEKLYKKKTVFTICTTVL